MDPEFQKDHQKAKKGEHMKRKRSLQEDQWKKGESSGKGKSTKGKKGKLNETSEEWDPESPGGGMKMTGGVQMVGKNPE